MRDPVGFFTLFIYLSSLGHQNLPGSDSTWHTCTLIPRCQPAAAWVQPTLGLCSCPSFIFTSTLSSPLPLCRFCTAAADRKLRLLTSDLQDKHEVKVAQRQGARCSQVYFSVVIQFSLAHTDVWVLGDAGSCTVADWRAAARKIAPTLCEERCSFTDRTLLFTWCFSFLLPR